jgi:hypothetical protein
LRGGRDHIDLGRRRLGKVTVLHVFFGSFGCGCVCYTTEIYVGCCWGTVYEQRCTGGGSATVGRWVTLTGSNSNRKTVLAGACSEEDPEALAPPSTEILR